MTTTSGAPVTPPVALGDGSGRTPQENPGSSPTPTRARLYAAIARVQAELPAIAKGETAKVTGQKADGTPVNYSYTYANLGAIAAEIMPLLGRNGLAFVAFPTQRTDPNRFVLAYSLVHESGEQIDGEYPLPDRWTPQQLGSAITYGRRYCLCAVTGVAPDDQDDDGAAASHVTMSNRQGNGQQAQAPQLPADVLDGRNRVAVEWARAFGTPVAETPEHYRRWTEGKDFFAADAAELRRYASFLATMPAPSTIGAAADAAASGEGEKPEADESQLVEGDRPMQPKDRAHIFALFAELGIKKDQDQRDTLSDILGREIESRKTLTDADAQLAIEVLKARKAALKQSAGAQTPVSDREDAPAQSSGADREGAPATGPEAPADTQVEQGEQ